MPPFPRIDILGHISSHVLSFLVGGVEENRDDNEDDFELRRAQDGIWNVDRYGNLGAFWTNPSGGECLEYMKAGPKEGKGKGRGRDGGRGDGGRGDGGRRDGKKINKEKKLKENSRNHSRPLFHRWPMSPYHLLVCRYKDLERNRRSIHPSCGKSARSVVLPYPPLL